jgi:uncharacterized protein YjbJ (UPF0337 family)
LVRAFDLSNDRADHASDPRSPEDHMSDLDNKAEKAKGNIKQAVGDLTEDDELRREGKIDHASGTAKEKVSGLKDKAEDAIESMKDKLTDKR